MRKQLKHALSLLLCVSLVCLPLFTILGAKIAAAAETSFYPAVQDAFVSNFNKQEDSLGISLNANKLIYGKLRHVYLKFDLSAIDTERYAIDEMNMVLNFRKSHAPNELVFTESESILRDAGDEWTVNNLTYNNRPYDIAETPVVTQNVTSTGEENLSVDLSAIFRNALHNGRTTISIHLTTTRVDDSTVSASEMFASRNASGYPGPTLSVTLGQPIVDDGIDKTALNALITEADQLFESDYEPTSWAVFAESLQEAKRVSGGNATQAEVDKALLSLQTTMDNLAPAELPVQIEAPDMGNYFNNGKTAAMIFRMKNEDDKYVKVDSVSEKLSLVTDGAEASTFALYVQDYFANVDHKEPEVGATRTSYAIRSLDTGKYLTIQNYYTAEEFLTNTHRYFNIRSGDPSGTSTDRTFEVKASASMPNWNERFYIDHFVKAGYYRIRSHLSTMRDDAGFNRFNVTMLDDAMQSSGTAPIDQEYRFYFEEVTGRDQLEVSQEVTGGDAVLFWRPVNGDTNPAHYSIKGSGADIVLADGLLRVKLSDLSVGVHDYTVAYNGGGYEAKADVTVRIFSHPGILLSADDLAAMKRHVGAKEEPWYSDYKRLLDSVAYDVASPDYETTVFSNVGRGGAPSDSANIGYFEKGGNAAYFNALQWVITGEEQYAEKAVDILTQWANGLKVIDGRDRILGAGINAYKYASAAEIIRYYDGGYSGYSDDDFKALQNMMINVVYPVIQDAAAPMLANGNWDAAAIVSMMAIGVLCDNTEIFDRAKALYQDIHVNGSIFAYVNDAGQTMETGRDQAHAMLALGYMAEICLIAYNQDEDLYSLYDYRLAKAFEYTAKYNLFSKELYGEDVPFVSMPNVFGDTSRGYYGVGFDSENNGLNRGELRPVFEQALAMYNKVGGFDLTWTKRAAEAMRPQGMVHFDNLNFGTLTQYNGEPLSSSGPYFQLRTRWEPLYQRNWSMVDGQRVAETLNSYYDVNENGELVTNVMKKDAPFYKLVANDDGTYSIRLVRTNNYLSVKDETVEGYNLIRADATTIGENEKFLLRSTGVGPFFLVSPKYDNRIVYQHAAGSGSNAVLTLRLGMKTLSQISDIPNVSTNERFIFMYNTEEIALNDLPKRPIGTPPTITTTALIGGEVGQSYSQTLAASGDGAITWQVTDGALPIGLSLSEDGLISGRPTKKGTYTFTVQAENSAGSDTSMLSIDVSDAASTPSYSVGPTLPSLDQLNDNASVTLNGTQARGTLTQNADGSFTLTSDAAQISAALGGGDELIIEANEVMNLTVKLPIAALGTAKLTIKSEFGTVTVPSVTLQHIRDKFGETLGLRVRKGSYIVEVLKDGQPVVYDEPGYPMTITLPVKVADGRDRYAYVAVKRGNGKDKIFPLAVGEDESASFDVTATGTYDMIDNGKTFQDISPAHWASRDITFMSARGLLEGTGDHRFSPATTMTRAMFAQLLANLEGLDRSASTRSAFSDVAEGRWYTAAVSWAATNGIFNGTGQGQFRPNDGITREQLAAILYNYAKYKGYGLPAQGTAVFADGSSIALWAREATAAMAASGILAGKPGGHFEPKGNVSRAEAATALARFIRTISSTQVHS